MPWFVSKHGSRYCVYKGERQNPGEKMKCYPTRQAALDYVKALYSNAEDIGKEDLSCSRCDDPIEIPSRAHREGSGSFHFECCPRCRTKNVHIKEAGKMPRSATKRTSRF